METASTHLLTAIGQERDNVIDLDILVDDCRRDGDLDAIIAAVAARDSAVAYLTALMTLASYVD